MQENKTLSRAEWLDKIFGTPVFAVLLAIFCNVLWGSAFPFIKLGYRLFSIDPANTASIFCFAGVRFMLGSVLVLLGSILLQGHAPHFPRGKVAAIVRQAIHSLPRVVNMKAPVSIRASAPNIC